MKFRTVIFWLHLVAGIVAGLVIAVMSFTGAALAFEKQIVAWAESDSRNVTPPASGESRLPIDALLAGTLEKSSGQRPTAITVANNPTAAVQLSFGRTNSFYVNPYTAEVQPISGKTTRDFMHLMVEWHRYLGRDGDGRAAGKAITGACNVAFLVLAISGFYLWWPRKWTGGVFRSIAVMSFKLKGKARDWNWHNTVGFWTAPILIVLTLTAMPISYRWATSLIYTMTGSPQPPAGNPRGSSGPSVEVPEPAAGSKPLDLEALFNAAQIEVPNWREISIRMAAPAGRGGGRDSMRTNAVEFASANVDSKSVERRSESGAGARGREESGRGNAMQPISVSVKERGAWPLFAAVQLTLDPFTGAVLQKESFNDYNRGRQVRSWTRFLHTGEALGWAGQLVAGLASLVSLLLVWTGFALSWRRFFKRHKA